MRVAVMDIGTNSCRLLVADTGLEEYVPPRVVRVFQTMEVTRVGEGIGKSGGCLKKEAVARTVDAMARFAAIAADYSVAQHIVVATAAVREAQNAAELVDSVKRRTGLTVQIISGEEEARLSFLGVVQGLPEAPAQSAVIDIGGGSTEFIWGRTCGSPKRPTAAGASGGAAAAGVAAAGASGAAAAAGVEVASVPIGAVRATEAELSPGQIENILEPTLAKMRTVHPANLIGVGGTVTTLAAMELRLEKYDPHIVHGCRISREAVIRWDEYLKTATLRERLAIPGLQPQRADIIPAGVSITRVVLDALDLPEITISETDLLWGLAWEAAQA